MVFNHPCAGNFAAGKWGAMQQGQGFLANIFGFNMGGLCWRGLPLLH